MEIIRPDNDGERRRALALLLSKPELSPSELDHNIEHLIRYTEKHGLSLEECLVAQENGRAIAACLCIDSPGRTTSVFIPAGSRLNRISQEVLALLREASVQAEARRIRLMQAMLTPEAKDEAAVFRQADFELVASLIFMENDLARAWPKDALSPQVEWVSYSQDKHLLFANTIEGSYIESLDCGSLNGLRNMDDILASHRAVGRFDPQLWQIATVNGQAIGAILLACLPDRWSFEVVYMGLLKSWRGRGYGSVLLKHALEISRERAGTALALTVDVRNAPAIKLYERFNFQENFRRDAWIKILPEQNTSAND
jgi:mycothiol synthase